jgi:hypothetical protein
MQSSAIDWPVIRNSLITLVLSIVLGACLVTGSIYFKAAMEREFNRNNAVFQNISRRYLAVDEEERLIQQYFPRFIGLHEQGVIGAEKRLDWIEVLRESGSAIELTSLGYSIQSQKAYIPSFPVNMSGFRLYSSTMQLNMQLLHEGDLFSLLEALDRNAPGKFTVAGCKLNNNTANATLADVNQSNVTAECHLEWFTLRLASGLEIEV